MVLTVLVVKSSFSFEKTTHLIYEVGPQESTIHGIIRVVMVCDGSSAAYLCVYVSVWIQLNIAFTFSSFFFFPAREQ